MSLYRSEVTLKNLTALELKIGTVTFEPGVSVTFWKTLDTGFPPAAFDVYEQIQANRDHVRDLAQSGSISITQDSIELTYQQLLTVLQMMSEMVASAQSLDKLLIPVKNQPAQADGIPLTASAPREGDEWVIGSHNYCDPCSWFGDSVRVNNETLTDSGDGLTFNSAHSNWIDMTSGRIHNEEVWVTIQKEMNPTDPHGYAVIVKSNGVLLTVREPFEASGGDYTVNSEDGKVIFFQSQVGKVVTVSYSYENGSTFYTFTADPKKVLVIEDAHCDISSDVVMTDSVVYSVVVTEDGTNWIEVDRTEYHRIGQIITEARGDFPVMEAVGASPSEIAITDMKLFRRTSRGMKGPRQSVPFHYSTARKLPQGVQIRGSLKHHRPLGGEHVTITFYCLEVDA